RAAREWRLRVAGWLPGGRGRARGVDSQVDSLHRRGRIPITWDRPHFEGNIQAEDRVGGKLDPGGGDVVLEVGDAPCSRNRHDMPSLSEQPPQRKLRRGDSQKTSQLVELPGERHPPPQPLALESRDARPPVVRRKGGWLVDPTGE